jgi:hypothetical protein
MAMGATHVVLTRLLFYALLPVAAATSIACLLVGQTVGLVEFFLYGFVPFALCSVFGMHLLLCTDPHERRMMEFVGLIVLSAVIVATNLLGIERRSLVLDAGVVLATVSVICQIKFIAGSQGSVRELRVIRLQEALIVPFAVSVTPFFLWLSSSINPTYDLHLYAFEASYGFQPSAVVVGAAQSVPGGGQVLQSIYDSLPLAVALLHAVRHRYASPESFLVIFVAATIVGFSLSLFRFSDRRRLAIVR